MNGNQGLEALAALCGGEAAVATDQGGSSQPDSSASASSSRDGASSAAAASSSSSNSSSTPAAQQQQQQQSLPEGITQQQWQQAVAAAAAFGSGGATPAASAAAGAAPSGAGGNFTAQSLALLQAAGLQAPPPAPVQQPTLLPNNNDAAQFAATMQQLAYFRHLQENAAKQQQSNNAAANVMNMNSLLYSNPQAMALALAGQANQFQQHRPGGDAAAVQQVLPAAASANAKSDAATKSMPPPPSGQGVAALPSTLSTAGIINSAVTNPRHTAIAPLPTSAGSKDAAVLSDGGTSYSSGTSGSGLVIEDKKFQKRAANRRSAQLSRKRKKQFIEELKDENDELRRKEQILRSIPDLIVVFDSAGKLWFVSQSVSRFMNMTARELEGTSFWDRLCEDSVRLLKAAFMDSLAARNDDSDSAPLGCGIWELRLVDKDGSHKVVTLNGVVHFSGDRPECVCSIRPRDDASMLPKRKQRKTAETDQATMNSKTGEEAAPAATVSTSNGSGNGSDGTTTTAASTDASGSGGGVRFQPLVRAMPQQSVINNGTAPSAGINKIKAAAANGKRRGEAARISDGDSGSTDDTDSGSSDELGEETTA